MAILRQDRYTICGVEIKRPTTFKIERYKVTNAVRLANSDMVADVLGRKRTFNFTYDAITATELNKILETLLRKRQEIVWNILKCGHRFR